MRRRRTVRAVAAVATSLLATACQAPEPDQVPLPPRAQVVDVSMSEYRIDHDGPVGSGRVVFRVRNGGILPHRLEVFAIDDDVPPIKQQLRSKERRPVTPFGALAVRPPGKSGSFALNLVAGRRYAMVCFLLDLDGQVHAVKGVASEFRAGKEPITADPPP